MIIYLIIVILILSILGILYWYTRNTHIVRINRKEIMEFKTAIELSGLPIIVFYQGEGQNKKSYNFLLDTGSNVSYVNMWSDLKVTPTGVKDTYMGSSGKDENCEMANVVLFRDGIEYKNSVYAADLNAAFTELKNEYGILVTGILGCDFMDKYNYCLDFKEFVAYRRK